MATKRRVKVVVRRSRLTWERRAKRAKIAWDALWLGVTSRTTKADRERLLQVFDGLTALDDEQAELRAGIEELLEAYADVPDEIALVEGLQRLLGRKG